MPLTYTLTFFHVLFVATAASDSHTHTYTCTGPNIFTAFTYKINLYTHTHTYTHAGRVMAREIIQVFITCLRRAKKRK